MLTKVAVSIHLFPKVNFEWIRKQIAALAHNAMWNHTLFKLFEATDDTKIINSPLGRLSIKKKKKKS